jgi:SAM-dependent methyltransferase
MGAGDLTKALANGDGNGRTATSAEPRPRRTALLRKAWRTCGQVEHAPAVAARWHGSRWRQRPGSAYLAGMTGFDDPAFYGDRWASVYDEHHAGRDAEPAAEFLAELAAGGRVLELAIGTGRVALPLAGRGIAVEGVDASEAMVARLRAKPGGQAIPVTIGDMADVPAGGPFRLVYLVFNTLFGLLSQARQTECFRNVARVLDPGGAFVIECFVPDLTRFDRGQRVQVLAVSADSATVELSRHDAAEQRITTQIVTLVGQGMQLRPVAVRYSWPPELDLMARLAGLRLRERYSDWGKRPFDSASQGHISVYRPA